MDATDVDDLYNTDDIDHDDSDISCDSSYSIDILFKKKHNKIKVDDKPSSSAEDPKENDSITEEHVMQASKMKYLDMVKDKEEKMDKSDEETKQSCPTFHLPDEASEEEKLMYASKMKYLTMAKEKGVLKKWEESATNEDATHKETEKEEELNRAIITQCYEGKAQDSQEGLLDDGKQSKYETVKEKESKRTIITQRYEGNAHDDPEGLLVFNDLPGGKRSMTKGACTHCDETFDNVEDLRKHLETVHNMVSCTICPKRIFAHNQSRVLHELSHKDSYPYIIYKDNWVCRFKCYKCPKEFTVSHKMASHLAIEHKEPPKKYHCPKCDIRFMMIRSFDLHFVKHFEDLQEGQCKICGKVLTGGFQCLKTHMQAVHERRRDHMCSICGHKTNQSGNLHRHMIRSHPSKMKKPLDFKCHICDKRFPLKDFLSRHMNTHGPNSYVCSICGEKLSSSEGFKRHWYTHTDVKRFHCFVCGKGYNDKRDVIRHSKKTHQINVDQDQISMTEAQKNFERELAKRDDPNKKSSKLEPL
ncbi:unnamed protein product [Owenia fusiformis]|uniref:C2H2-type domain-containing protein n=1 Tax=Owenia fusiformis TaxID=6347 RepID=A0A8S4PW41_OWEFU|nr:unnamed protein product [Owenia fusiformis]